MGAYLILVLHQVREHVIRVQDPPVAVLHVVGPNQEVPLLRDKRDELHTIAVITFWCTTPPES